MPSGFNLFKEQKRFLLFAFVFFGSDASAAQQVVAEILRRFHVFLGDSLALKNLKHGCEKNLHVTQKGDIVNIANIAGELILPCYCVAAAYLSKPRKPRANAVPPPLFICHKSHVAHKLRPRSDAAHFPRKNEPHLRQLIKRSAAKASCVCHPAAACRMHRARPSWF